MEHTYHMDIKFLQPLWIKRLLLGLRLEDLLSVESEDSVRIGFAFKAVNHG